MIVIIKRLVAIVIMISCFQASWADEQAAQALNTLLAQTETMKADFSQTITDKSAHEIQSATGKMILQRPGKFRWEVLQPIAQLVVANGKKLWIYDPDLEQVTIRLISKEMGDTPALLLSNTEETLTNHFTVKSNDDSVTGIHWFTLSPTSQNSMLETIKLGFMNQRIHTMLLEDHLGHTTIIEFKNVVVNRDVSNAAFKFKLPANVDVIDETHPE